MLLIMNFLTSYHNLNRITLPFEYPIPRCLDAIESLGDSAGRLFFISTDSWQVFHQIKVLGPDQQKLAFFGPDHKKYTFSVMPFGPILGVCLTHVLPLVWDSKHFTGLS